MWLALPAFLVFSLGTSLFAGGPASAASHSDAPLIKQDPQANITDVYAFMTQGGLNVVVHVRPFSEPGDGPHYERFADDALYSIHIADPSSGETTLRYDFMFSDANPVTGPGLKNPDTAFSYGVGSTIGAIQDIGDGAQNYTQTYAIRRNGVPVTTGVSAPPNVGLRTTPHYNDASTGFAISGATNMTELDAYTQQAIHTLPEPNGGVGLAFAGPREDGFYADIPGIFDLLDGRILGPGGLGQDGSGVDGFKGFNVLAYAIQIPLESLADLPGSPSVGVYASVSRRRIRLLQSHRNPVDSGPWVQVNRMGNPLFNEALVALRDKDNYNRRPPTVDAFSFASYALNPELVELINAVFGTSFPETGRGDLVSVFIPDVLRVDTSTGPVPLAGQSGFSRLSAFGGDTTNGAPSGFPNGRRFGDDVVDIFLTMLSAGGVSLLGDNTNANDQIYHQTFPFSATPHAGPQNRKDP
jgi:hypothetical protein